MKAGSKVTSILSSHARVHFQDLLSEYQSGHLLSSWFCPIPFGCLTTREQTIEKTLGLRVGNNPVHDREFHWLTSKHIASMSGAFISKTQRWGIPSTECLDEGCNAPWGFFSMLRTEDRLGKHSNAKLGYPCFFFDFNTILSLQSLMHKCFTSSTKRWNSPV